MLGTASTTLRTSPPSARVRDGDGIRRGGPSPSATGASPPQCEQISSGKEDDAEHGRGEVDVVPHAVPLAPLHSSKPPKALADVREHDEEQTRGPSELDEGGNGPTPDDGCDRHDEHEADRDEGNDASQQRRVHFANPDVRP